MKVRIWVGGGGGCCEVSSNCTHLGSNTHELQKEIKNWVKLFLKQYQAKHSTPHVHAFVYYVPKFSNKFGGVCKFNQQGLEKLHDVTTQHYLHAANHRELEALTQVMDKRNPLENWRTVAINVPLLCLRHCSICRGSDHIRTKCPFRPQPLQVKNSSVSRGGAGPLSRQDMLILFLTLIF